MAEMKDLSQKKEHRTLTGVITVNCEVILPKILLPSSHQKQWTVHFGKHVIKQHHLKKDCTILSAWGQQ